MAIAATSIRTAAQSGGQRHSRGRRQPRREIDRFHQREGTGATRPGTRTTEQTAPYSGGDVVVAHPEPSVPNVPVLSKLHPTNTLDGCCSSV